MTNYKGEDADAQVQRDLQGDDDDDAANAHGGGFLSADDAEHDEDDGDAGDDLADEDDEGMEEDFTLEQHENGEAAGQGDKNQGSTLSSSVVKPSTPLHNATTIKQSLPDHQQRKSAINNKNIAPGMQTHNNNSITEAGEFGGNTSAADAPAASLLERTDDDDQQQYAEQELLDYEEDDDANAEYAVGEEGDGETLDDMRSSIRQMEAEADKMRAMQTVADKRFSSSKISEPAAVLADDKMEIDARSVYVGNVDYAATAEELEKHFHACGNVVRVTILCDKFTGYPKGFAYIEFGEKEAVDTALALDESMFRGRQIKVSSKRTNQPGISSTDRGRARGGGGISRGGRPSRRPFRGGFGGGGPMFTPRGRGFGYGFAPYRGRARGRRPTRFFYRGAA